MADIDSYLLKCALESLEKGVSSEETLKNCESQMGFTYTRVENHNHTKS
jgi:hypothetical protein